MTGTPATSGSNEHVKGVVCHALEKRVAAVVSAVAVGNLNGEKATDRPTYPLCIYIYIYIVVYNRDRGVSPWKRA